MIVRLTIDDGNECVYAASQTLEVGPHIARDIVNAISTVAYSVIKSIANDLTREWQTP